MSNRWGNNGNSDRLYFGGAPKSLQMVTAAMKLKDACSLKEKLRQPQFSSVAQLCPTLCDWTELKQPWLQDSVSRHQGLSQWVSSLHKVAKVLELQLQHQFFQWMFRTDFLWDGLVGSPCSPRDSQESSPTPQFKSINSSVLIFLYSLTLISIHDHWKNHSFDYMDLCQHC